MCDLTEVDSEDDSDCDSGPESFVFPAESDDDLDSVIDALERDLEDVGVSVQRRLFKRLHHRSTCKTFQLLTSAPDPEASNLWMDHVPFRPAVHARVQHRKGELQVSPIVGSRGCGSSQGFSRVGIRVGNR